MQRSGVRSRDSRGAVTLAVLVACVGCGKSPRTSDVRLITSPVPATAAATAVPTDRIDVTQTPTGASTAPPFGTSTHSPTATPTREYRPATATASPTATSDSSSCRAPARLRIADLHPVDGVRAVVVSPNGDAVYIARRCQSLDCDGQSERDAALIGFARDGSDGSLAPLDVPGYGPALTAAFRDPGALAISPDGRHVYLASATETSIATCERAFPDWPRVLQFVDRPHTLAGIRSLAMSPDGNRLYAVGGGALTAYARDGESGLLSIVAERADDVPQGYLAQARGLAVSPDGASVYVAGLRGMAHYSHRSADDALQLVETWSGSGFEVENLPAWRWLNLTANGATLYAAGGEGVAVFERSTLNGALTALELEQGLRYGGAYDSPSAHALAVNRCRDRIAGSFESVVRFFHRAPTGELYEVDRVQGYALSGPVAMAYSPDEANLYVAGAAGLATLSSAGGY